MIHADSTVSCRSKAHLAARLPPMYVYSTGIVKKTTLEEKTNAAHWDSLRSTLAVPL